MRKHLAHAVLLHDPEEIGPEERLRPQLEVVAVVGGDLPEESVELLRQPLRRLPGGGGLVFLLEDDPLQPLPEERDGGALSCRVGFG